MKTSFESRFGQPLAVALVASALFWAGCENATEDKASSGKEDKSATEGSVDQNDDDSGKPDKEIKDEKSTQTPELDSIETNLTIKEKVVGDLGLSVINKSSGLVMKGRDSLSRYGNFLFTESKGQTKRCALLGMGITPDQLDELALGEWGIVTVAAANKILADKSMAKVATFSLGTRPERACVEKNYNPTAEEEMTQIEWSSYSGKVEFLGYSKDAEGRKTAVLRYSAVRMRSDENDLSGANDGDPGDDKIYVGELEVSGTLVVEAEKRPPETGIESDPAP